MRNLRNVEISSSMPWDVDTTVEEMLAERKSEDQPLRARINVTLFSPKLARHMAWKQVAWGVGIRTLEEAQQLRTGLQLFFRAAATFGMAATVRRLQDFVKEGPEVELPVLTDEDPDA